MKTLLRIVVLMGLCLAVVSPLGAADERAVQSVLFKEDKALVFREGGSSQAATNDVLLPEGIKVMTNGTFTVKGGKGRQLREGQQLGADGMLTSPDGSVVPVVDHLVMKNGRLHTVKDGESTQAGSDVVLGDGTRIKADGTITGKDGRIRRMLDGQLFKLNGSTIPTTDTALLKDGKVTLQKDGGRLTLRRDQTMMMSDGTKVGGDGTLTRADGSKSKLPEGEIVKFPGVLPPKR